MTNVALTAHNYANHGIYYITSDYLAMFCNLIMQYKTKTDVTCSVVCGVKDE